MDNSCLLGMDGARLKGQDRSNLLGRAPHSLSPLGNNCLLYMGVYVPVSDTQTSQDILPAKTQLGVLNREGSNRPDGKVWEHAHLEGR